MSDYKYSIEAKNVNKIFYRKDRIKKLTTKCSISVIKKNMGWCNDVKSKKNYNKIVKTNSKFKKIDCLINNVGIAGPTGTLEKLSSKDWEKTLKTNVISHFYFTKLAIPFLKTNRGVQ